MPNFIMVESDKIKLIYFETIWQQWQWFLLYEFKIIENNFFENKDEEIIQMLIGSKIIGKDLFHSEMIQNKTKVQVQNVRRPYIFEKLSFVDFNFFSNNSDFKKWLQKFRNDDWADDQKDAEILIDAAEKEITSRTLLKNGVWHLSKYPFEKNPEKLIKNHWTYLHFETFVEIDRQNLLIRTFDFGYD